LSISAISKRYAKALVMLGTEQRMVDPYAAELDRVNEVLCTETKLRLILESPTFPLEKKAAMLADVTAVMKLSSGMHSFLGLLLENDRLKYLGQITEDYQKFADELSGVVRARVTAAASLDDSQQQALKAGLEKQTGKKVELKVDLDPSLIGGLQAEIAGRVFDGSVRTQLKRIEDTLKKG